MEWNRGVRPTQAASGTGVAAEGPSHHRSSRANMKSLKYFSVALLFSATVLVVALISYMIFGTTNSEGRYVDTSKMQAVFINGGQVYFGNIKSLNQKYLRLSNIYYLRVNQQVQPNTSTTTNNDVSLVKLGCELHAPTDTMLINRDQVIFWENLKDDGQVAKAVADYVKANPNGQVCAAPTTNTTPTPTTTTPTPTTPSKKTP